MADNKIDAYSMNEEGVVVTVNGTEISDRIRKKKWLLKNRRT
jgi:hypothetical protein